MNKGNKTLLCAHCGYSISFDSFESYPDKCPNCEKQNFLELDLQRQPPIIIKPFGFYNNENLLVESTWLPYTKIPNLSVDNESKRVVMKPSVFVGKKKDNKLVFSVHNFISSDFVDEFELKGDFPEREFPLMSKNVVKKLLENNYEIDKGETEKNVLCIIQKHFYFPTNDPQLIFVKYWIIGAYFHDVFDSFPILNITGVSEGGKTRLLLVIKSLSYHGTDTINPTQAGIFRDKESLKPTLCIDEEEYLKNPIIAQTVGTLINASYSKEAGTITRYDEQDQQGKRIRKRFYLYSPLAIAGIRGMPGVTESRSINIITQRINKDYPKAYIKDYEKERDQLYLLYLTKAFELKKIYDNIDISTIVSGRFEELLKPIFALCKFFDNQKEWDILIEWAKEYEQSFRAEGSNISDEEQTLLSLDEILNENQEEGNTYHLKDLKERINEKYGRKLHSKTVSSILKRLHITKRSRDGKGTTFTVTQGMIEHQKVLLGLSNKSTFATQSTFATPESVGNEGNVGNEENNDGDIKLIIDMMPQQTQMHYTEIAKAVKYDPEYIKGRLKEITADPNNPYPIRRADKQGDYYILERGKK